MLEKFAQETASGAARDVRTADTRRGQRAADTGNSVIVQFVKFLRRSAPITDVGFIPHFPIPARDRVTAIPLYAMFCPLIYQLSPPRIILRRISPAAVNLVILRSGPPLMLIRLRF